MSSIATSRRRRTAAQPSRRRQRRAQGRRRDLKRRRRMARKARAARRELRRLQQAVPEPARSLFDSLAGAFTRPTFLRIVVLALATILTVGGRTICNLLRTLGALAPGHPSSYHRVFSKRRGSAWRLARGLSGWVVDHLTPTGPVLLAGDDTGAEHPGDKVFGKGCHRDPVRSTHSFTAYRWGHKWVVLAMLVRFPFCRRRWALPLLVALYRPEEEGVDGVTKRAHKTPVDLLGQMLRILIRWFPDRRFLCCADGNYAAHELAEVAAANPQRLTLVSKFYPHANLFEPPPPVPGKRPAHRPCKKGKELPDPAEVVRATAERPVWSVAWYGGGR